MTSTALTLILPTYNESEIIEDSLRKIEKAIGPALASETEILIADDGSDSLPAVVEGIRSQFAFAQLHTMRNPTRLGKGRSIANAIQLANGKVIGFMDADLSTPPEYIKSALEKVQSTCDILIASRRHKDSNVQRKQSLAKKILGDLYYIFCKKLFFNDDHFYTDTQCGFKFFKKQAAQILYKNLTAKDGLADLEILIRANWLNYRVQEIGVNWKDDRESKRSLWYILKGEVFSLAQLIWVYGFNQKSQKEYLSEISYGR